VVGSISLFDCGDIPEDSLLLLVEFSDFVQERNYMAVSQAPVEADCQELSDSMGAFAALASYDVEGNSHTRWVHSHQL
jgi:hypothetical protein